MSLVFPRTPQDLVRDNGTDNYLWVSPELENANWHFAIVAVDDEGNAEAAPAEHPDSPIRIAAPPDPPTDIGALAAVVGADVIVTLGWAIADPGNTYRVYRGDRDTPVNYEDEADPAPDETAIDAESYDFTIPLADVAPADYTSDFDDVDTAFADAVADLLTAYAAGESGFLAAVETFRTALFAALNAFESATGCDVEPFIDDVANVAAALRAAAGATGSNAADYVVDGDFDLGATAIRIKDGTGIPRTNGTVSFGGGAEEYIILAYSAPYLSLAGGLEVAISDGDSVDLAAADPAEWAAALLQPMAIAASALGEILAHNSKRFVVPDAADVETPTIEASLDELVTPRVQKARYRFAVHAKDADGHEERAAAEIELVFNADGSIAGDPPNAASIEAPIRITAGLTLNIVAGVTSDNAKAVATIVNLYVVAHGAPFDFDTPQASAALPASQLGYHHAALTYTVPAAGHYDITVKAETALGELSERYGVITRYISDDAPSAVVALEPRKARR